MFNDASPILYGRVWVLCVVILERLKMRKVIDYMLATYLQVPNFLEKGWELWGSPFNFEDERCTPPKMPHQAMVKYAEPEEKMEKQNSEPVCQTMKRSVKDCGCPDCGPSLIDYHGE